MRGGHAKNAPGVAAWRRIMRGWRQGQLRSRGELLSLLRGLDGQSVQLRSKADRFGRVDVWTGKLDATHVRRGQVDLTLLSGEESSVLVSWIGYVVHQNGDEYGPFKTPVSLWS